MRPIKTIALLANLFLVCGSALAQDCGPNGCRMPGRTVSAPGYYFAATPAYQAPAYAASPCPGGCPASGLASPTGCPAGGVCSTACGADCGVSAPAYPAPVAYRAAPTYRYQATYRAPTVTYAASPGHRVRGVGPIRAAFRPFRGLFRGGGCCGG